MRLVEWWVIALMVGWLLAPADAFAYLDPVTGSMVWQIVVGGLLAAGATVKMYWRNIRSFFRRKKELRR